MHACMGEYMPYFHLNMDDFLIIKLNNLLLKRLPTVTVVSAYSAIISS